jgi:hypothetical protein
MRSWGCNDGQEDWGHRLLHVAASMQVVIVVMLVSE